MNLSLQQLGATAWTGLRTFPVSILSSLLLALMAMTIEDKDLFGTAFQAWAEQHWHTMLAAWLGSLWLHGAALTGATAWWRWVAFGLALLGFDQLLMDHVLYPD
ncbi:hypothetical protein RZS08_30300, partial [Arthrospira platensis SPKY1]|nr:hypothetical protein [Arthrospira platensis SPKY1]